MWEGTPIYATYNASLQIWNFVKSLILFALQNMYHNHPTYALSTLFVINKIMCKVYKMRMM
jgi:hypothetical protein